MARTPPVFVVDAPPLASASDPTLEQQLRAAPEDAALAQVYADWLIEHGDPRGELAMAQLRGDTAREKALLEAHGGWLAGVDPKVAAITWRPGRFRIARFMNRVDWMHSSFDAKLVAERILTQPAANCLEELAVGVLRWEYMNKDLHALLGVASQCAFAPTLRRLHLGDHRGIDIDCAHHELGDLPNLDAFSGLRELQVWGFQIGFTDGLRLPHLGSLKVQTCGLGVDALDAVLGGELPALRQLELWFGSEDYGAEADVDALERLLDGSVLPTVTDLGLCNAEFTNDLVPALLASKVLPRLTRLDLSKGTLDARGVRVLVAQADRWRHLTSLDVSESFLTDDDIAALSAVGPEILAGDQKDIEDTDEDWRYVSVAE